MYALRRVVFVFALLYILINFKKFKLKTTTIVPKFLTTLFSLDKIKSMAEH